VTLHGHAECLSRGPSMQLCMDSCCFVLELVGVCIASENGYESVGIKLDDHILDVDIFCKCVLFAQRAVLFRKFRTPSIPGTTPMIRSLPGLGRMQQWKEDSYFFVSWLERAAEIQPVLSVVLHLFLSPSMAYFHGTSSRLTQLLHLFSELLLVAWLR
jgi:hypothetical protein